MGKLTSIFGQLRPSADIESQRDDVFPVHALDSMKSRRIFVARVMRFNDVLDGPMLQRSLCKLLEIGNWRKLGGSLRYTSRGDLEIHVPQKFGVNRPPLTFTHDEFLDLDIDDHPKAGMLHVPTNGASIKAVPAPEATFISRPDFPATVDEMIRRDMPQLLLHVTSFRNATLVSLVWPHTIADAFGVVQLLQNWSLVLAGRAEQVSPILGANDDVLQELEDAQPKDEREALVIEPMRLGGFPMARWIIRLVWYQLRNPAFESKTVFLPKTLLGKLNDQIQREISETDCLGASSTFASENDILTAWIAHIVCAAEPAPQPITVMAFLNLRAKLSRLSRADNVYAQNMLMFTYAFLSVQQLQGTTGGIALAHRRHFKEQTSESQVLSFMRMMRHGLTTAYWNSLLFGDLKSFPIIFNNFIRADFLKSVDFGPAVLRAGDTKEERANPPGTMIVYYYRVFSAPLARVASFYMLGKDHGGNGWFQGNLPPRAWAEMQRRLHSLEQPQE